jgi:hypothetical protein
MTNWRGCASKPSWPVPAALKVATKSLSLDIRCSGRDSNRDPANMSSGQHSWWCRITLQERASGASWIDAGWVSESVWSLWRRDDMFIYCTCRKSNPDSPVVKPCSIVTISTELSRLYCLVFFDFFLGVEWVWVHLVRRPLFGRRCLRNVNTHPPNHTASHPRNGKHLWGCIMMVRWRRLLRRHQKVTSFCFQDTTGPKIAIPEISLNTQVACWWYDTRVWYSPVR